MKRDELGEKLCGLLKDVVGNLVDSPDKVVVQRRTVEGALMLTVTVATREVGQVIGKQGRIAEAIRTIVKAAARHLARRGDDEFPVYVEFES
jgi:hypothetical protein